MPNLNIRVAPSLSEAFAGLCEKRGTSVSAALRQFMEYAVDHADEADWLRRRSDVAKPATSTVKYRFAEPQLVSGVPVKFGGLGIKRLTPVKARGFAVDGSGEITQEQLAKNRQSELVRTKGKAKP